MRAFDTGTVFVRWWFAARDQLQTDTSTAAKVHLTDCENETPVSSRQKTETPKTEPTERGEKPSMKSSASGRTSGMAWARANCVKATC